VNALLIPLKDPTNAKSRLSRLLDPDERRNLAWVMFEDVCRAVAKATVPDRVFVVSSYVRALDFANNLGWGIIEERHQRSESASVDEASRILSERGYLKIMRLPADVPLVRAEDVDAVLATALESPCALLVPSRDGSGTNAIIRTPPTVFPSRFGPGSLALHKTEAFRAGAACLVVENQRIALDIDQPEDLDVLMREGPNTRTYQFIKSLEVDRAQP